MSKPTNGIRLGAAVLTLLLVAVPFGLVVSAAAIASSVWPASPAAVSRTPSPRRAGSA